MLLDRDNLIVCLHIALPFSNRRAPKRREVIVKPHEREERILCYHCFEQRAGLQRARYTGENSLWTLKRAKERTRHAGAA